MARKDAGAQAGEEISEETGGESVESAYFKEVGGTVSGIQKDQGKEEYSLCAWSHLTGIGIKGSVRGG